MSADLWLSVALAIPLAIAANIITPKVQRWLESRAFKGKEQKAAKQAKQRQAQLESMKAELEETKALYADKTKLIHLNLIALLRVTLYGALGTLYGTIFGFVGEISNWTEAARLGAQATTLIVAMLIYFTCSKALRLSIRVSHFSSYKARAEHFIGELEKVAT